MTGPRTPRSSAEVVRSSLEDLRSRRKRHALRRTVLGLALLAALVWGGNHFMLDRPVTAALASDPRTAGIGLVARFDHWVNLTTIVLDLQRAGVADTDDVLRGVLVIARDLGRLSMVHRVVLARNGEPVYAMTGDDFRKVGREFTLIRNPLVALRDLNEALRLPGGAKPPLADIGTTARHWASGAQ
jgi:hypothetical protein